MTLFRPRNDESLLVAIAAGDQASFERFYKKYQAPVLGFHLRRTGNREIAFDLTAETFAAVMVAAGQFDAAKGSAAGWLFGVAANKLGESLRRGVVESAARSVLHMQAVVMTDDDIERVEELASLADERSIEQMLEGLSVEQRAAIFARVVEERPYEDIAVQMQCSAAVVRQRVARGLKSLRQELGEAR